ncbi:unnamed protein product, partial [Allacma fusca]
MLEALKCYDDHDTVLHKIIVGASVVQESLRGWLNRLMMPGKKDYRRWQYSDETEMSVEEQLTLEDHDHTDETPSTTFSQPIVAIHTARVHSKRSSKASACKAK